MASNTTMPNNTMCTLRTKQGDIIVSINAIKESNTIKGMLECFGDDDGSDGNIIPINNIKLETLTKIIEYCNYVIENKLALENAKEWIKDYKWEKQIDPWFIKFLSIPKDDLIDLLNAVNFLDIEVLLRMICKCYASMMKNRTPEELYDLFNISSNIPIEATALAKKNEDTD
jgi:S-phase kinase-associated protein 1